MKPILAFLILCSISTVVSAEKVLNVYAWGGEIPKHVIQQFETQTGITVHFSTYDTNETMYAKLRASRTNSYDIIMPSAHFVERMRKKHMLTRLDHTKLPNLKNINPIFMNHDYDKGNQYSVPLIWGTTGIVYNQHWVKNPPTQWQDLWDKRWKQELLLVDDPREIFSIALLRLGYRPDDTNPKHIQEAFEQLLALVPNIKLFASDSLQAIMIDEDAILGAVWNGDALKAHRENKNIQFVYPENGFIIWIDSLAIPKGARHLEAAYLFIDFLLEPKVSAKVALVSGYGTTSAAGKKQLPPSIRNNPIMYPPSSVLKRGYFEHDVGEATTALYHHYWNQLKLAF